MLGITTVAITTLLLAVQVASATEIHHVIHDTRSDRYHVYRRDGSVYGRFNDYESFKREIEYEMPSARATIACPALTLEQAKTLPGWGKIEQYAKDTYGTGGWNIVVNPAEYPDASANVCVDSEVVQVEMTSAPSCDIQESTIKGKYDQTNGTVKLTHMEGATNEATWTVTQSTSIGASATFSVEMAIPKVAKVSGGVSITAEVTNETGTSFKTSVNNQVTQELSYDSVPGKECSASMTTRTCSLNGQGKVRMVANGFIWFNYEDKRAPVNDPNGGEHYKYAVNIASAVSNMDERSSWLDFVGSMKTTSCSDYQVHC